MDYPSDDAAAETSSRGLSEMNLEYVNYTEHLDEFEQSFDARLLNDVEGSDVEVDENGKFKN